MLPQVFHHLQVDLPLVGHRFLGKWQCRHIGYRAEFRTDVKYLFTSFQCMINYFLPSGYEPVQSWLPFRGKGMVYLGSLGKSDPGMNVPD